MSRGATGNEFALAVIPDTPLIDVDGEYITAVGVPRWRPKVLAAMSAPTSALGAAGNLTGDRIHYVAAVLDDGSETEVSAGSTPLTLTADKATVTFVNPSDTRVREIRIYGSDDAGERIGRVGRVYRFKQSGEDNAGVLGLDDASWSGTYTGVGIDAEFEVEVLTAATPDTARWRKNGGAWTGFNMTAGATLLSDGISFTTGASTGHTVGSVWKFVSFSTIFSDNLATPDYSHPPKTVSQVGVEDGLRGIYIRDLKMRPGASSAPTPELRGNIFPAAYVPGPWDMQGTIDVDVRAGTWELASAAQFGAPIVYGVRGGTRVALPAVVDEATRIAVRSPSTSRLTPRSFSFVRSEGLSALGAEHMQSCIVLARQAKFVKGEVVSATITLLAHGAARVGRVATVSVTGTYWDTYRPVARGYRVDADADTTAIYGKVTTAPAGGTVGISFKTGGGAAYDHEVTFTYDASGQHIAGSAEESHWTELSDQDGNAYGADFQETADAGLAENRLPFALHLEGNLTLLNLNDEFQIPVKMDPISTALRKEIEPRLTSAGLRLLYGDIEAVTYAPFLSGTLDIGYQAVQNAPLDCNVLMPVDSEHIDVAQWNLNISRRYMDRVFQAIVERNERLALSFSMRGGRVLNQPGGQASAERRGVYYEVGSSGLPTSPTRDVSGRGQLEESFDLMAYDPEDGTDAVEETIIGSLPWEW